MPSRLATVVGGCGPLHDREGRVVLNLPEIQADEKVDIHAVTADRKLPAFYLTYDRATKAPCRCRPARRIVARSQIDYPGGK
jgi:hypothetical protein